MHTRELYFSLDFSFSLNRDKGLYSLLFNDWLTHYPHFLFSFLICCPRGWFIRFFSFCFIRWRTLLLEQQLSRPFDNDIRRRHRHTSHKESEQRLDVAFWTW